MLHEIKANRGQCNYIIAVNSYDHQGIWREDLIKAGIAKESISLISCYEADNVIPQIIRALKGSPRHGQILLITHAAYNLMPYLPRKPWKIVIDEVPECQWYEALSVSVTVNAVTFKSLVDADMPWPSNPELLVLKRKPLANFGRRLQGLGNVGDAGWVRLLNSILDKRRIVLVSRKQWENPGATNTFGFLSVYNFASHHDKHHDVTFLAANFKESFPYLIAKGQGTKMRERTFATPLRGPVTKRSLRIEYSLDRLPSKRFLNFKGGEAKKLLHDRVRKDWAAHDYLYVLNKDEENLDSGSRLAFTEIKGVNSKTSYDRIYFGAAINLKPHHYNLLSLYGINRDAANKAVALELAYQAVMRTSLRDPESNNPVVIRVPSKVQADYLQCVIGFGDVVNLEEKLRDPLPRRRYETAINNWRAHLDELPQVERRMAKKQIRKWQNESWRVMCGMARAGLPHSNIRTICLNAAANNHELRKHVEYEVPRLKRWCSQQTGMPGTEGLEAWQ
jgi:hypothetical protein